MVKFKGHGAVLGMAFVLLNVLAPHGFACKAQVAPQRVDLYGKLAFHPEEGPDAILSCTTKGFRDSIEKAGRGIRLCLTNGRKALLVSDP